MANPRKFSEKIALHNQKQAEETAAFEQIMKEVIGATRGPPKNNHLHINQSLGGFRAGSLPNVNQITTNSSSIDLQCLYQDYEAKQVNRYMPNWSALDSLEDMKQGREVSADRIHRERGRHAVPHQSRRFAFENKHMDVSPYNSSYLSPPPDTNWRRTNSDSALHQSTMNLEENFGPNAPPLSNSRPFEMDGNVLQEQVGDYWDSKKQQLVPALHQNRPKSCEVPGINIYPTQEESGSVPISSNTGSLPDLTNLHFPPPLATPLDMEDHTSPSVTLSPSSSLQHTHVLTSGTAFTSPGSRHSSPGPSPSPSSRRRHHHLTNLVIGGQRHHNFQQQVRYRPPTYQQHRSSSMAMEGLTMEANALSLETYNSQQPQFGVYPQQQSPSKSPQRTFTYESQVSMGSYRSSSPADHSCSAPTSPVSHSLSPSSSPGLGSVPQSSSYSDSSGYYVQQQLQHQLEQFKMKMPDNCPSDVGSQNNNAAMFLATVDSGGGETGNFSGLGSAQDMLYSIANLGGSSPNSPTLYSKSTVISSSHQTPTTIPDIILTAPGGDQDFAKDLGSAISNMCGSFDSDFFTEDAIRAGLGPIDFDGLQILTDPEMPIISDSPADDTCTFHVEGS